MGLNHPSCRLARELAGVLTVRFNPLLLTTNDYTLWIMFYFDGVVYCDYKNICPFFVSRKDNAIDRGAYFLHPGQIVIQLSSYELTTRSGLQPCARRDHEFLARPSPRDALSST